MIPLPLKQGLKLYLRKVNNWQSVEVMIPLPLKQGLKLSDVGRVDVLAGKSYDSTSTKTRIETRIFSRKPGIAGWL